MNPLRDLRKILTPTAPTSIAGTVVGVQDTGRVSVRTSRSVVACTSLIPVSTGDRVNVQGTLIVSRQFTGAGGLPEYRV